MAALTPADVERELGRSLTTPENARVVAMIADYQAQVEAHLHRSIEQRPFTEGGYLRNNRWIVGRGPIVSVTTLTMDGVPLASGSGYRVLNRDTIEIFFGGWLGFGFGGYDYTGIGNGMGYGYQPVTVTYVGGWDAQSALPAKRLILDKVVAVIFRAASGTTGLASETVEGDGLRRQVDYVGTSLGPTLLTPEELACVSALKLRTLV